LGLEHNVMQALLVPSRAPAAIAIALNLIPVIGVVFWGWSAFALILLYWLENLIIGARTVLAMAATGLAGGGASLAGALAIGAFFTLHYGMFCLVHGTFVLAMFGGGEAGGALFDVFGAVGREFAREPNLVLGLASIAVWQAVQLVLFIARGEVKSVSPLGLMAAPYPRIIVLHVTIIFGGFLLLLLNQPVAGLVVLALVKMAFDVAEAMGKTPRLEAAKPT
jgi:hypothetical protein